MKEAKHVWFENSTQCTDYTRKNTSFHSSADKIKCKHEH